MVSGAETPLVSNILAGAQSGSGGAVSDSSGSSLKNQSSVQRRPEADVADLVDISAESRSQVANNEQGAAQPETLNLKRVIEEFEQSLDDENRIPPSIFNQMRKLLEAALQSEQKPQIDRLA